jgi:hypothetical protein
MIYNCSARLSVLPPVTLKPDMRAVTDRQCPQNLTNVSNLPTHSRCWSITAMAPHEPQAGLMIHAGCLRKQRASP